MGRVRSVSNFILIKDINAYEMLVNLDQVFSFEADRPTDEEVQQYGTGVVAFISIGHTGSTRFRILITKDYYDDIKHQIITRNGR